MCHDSEGKAYRLPQQQGTSKGMTNYRNGGRFGHNGPPGTAKETE